MKESIYKRAVLAKLRFKTSFGSLTVEQLYALTIDELDKMAVAYEVKYKGSESKSFINKVSTTSVKDKLKFEIVLDVLETNVNRAEAATNRAEKKVKNQKIMDLILRKQDSALENLSVKELEALMED